MFKNNKFWVPACSITPVPYKKYCAYFTDDNSIFSTGKFDTDGVFRWDEQGLVPVGKQMKRYLMVLDDKPLLGQWKLIGPSTDPKFVSQQYLIKRTFNFIEEFATAEYDCALAEWSTTETWDFWFDTTAEDFEADPWIPLVKGVKLPKGKDFLVQFDTGEVRRYYEDDLPVSIMTHFMHIPKLKK